MHNHAVLGCFILLLIAVLFSYYFKKYIKKRKYRKLNIYEWMNMGKRMRKDFDHGQMISIMERKKELILNSRKEYLKYKDSIAKEN